MVEHAEKTKVNRSRKRIYEAPVEEVTVEAASAETPAGMVAETSAMVPETHVAADPAEDRRYAEALKIVRGATGWSAGAGLIPLPLVDMAALMAVQVRMLKQLAQMYDVTFSAQLSKSAVAVLLSGINTGVLAGSSAKIFPFTGIFSMAAMPAVNGAVTYAVGRVFIQHFASGGTFLDFDPRKVKAYFEEQYRKAS